MCSDQTLPAFVVEAESLQPGTVIRIPRSSPTGRNEAVRREPTPISELEGAAVNASVERHHVVQEGESLYTIAQRYRPHAGWQWLHDANRNVVDEPQDLRAGTRLRIPHR